MKMGYFDFFRLFITSLWKGAYHMEPMELGHAEKIIGVGQKYNMQHALRCFEIVHWAKKQNREFDLLPTTIEAKNVIMRNLITEQKKKFRFFEIESPFKDTCPKCRGAGEIFKFFKKSVKVNCHICGGSSKIEGNCPKCKGTGRFVKKWKEGGGVNLKCKRCQGKGKVKLSCQECKGKGKIQKAVLSDELKSTTPCRQCRQLGFLTKDHQKKKIKKPQKHQRSFQFNPIEKITSKDGRTLADVIKGS